MADPTDAPDVGRCPGVLSKLLFLAKGLFQALGMATNSSILHPAEISTQADNNLEGCNTHTEQNNPRNVQGDDNLDKLFKEAWEKKANMSSAEIAKNCLWASKG